MLELVTWLWARPGADFAARWRDHVALLPDVPQLRRAVQNHPVEVASPVDSPEQADGVAELWFDDEAALRAALASPGFRALVDDLAAFADLERSGSLVAERRVVDDRPPAAVKLCAAGHRRPDLTRAEAQRYWGDVHPGVVAAATEFYAHVRRYVQGHPRDWDGPTIGRVLEHDLAPELFFDSVEELAAAFAEPQYLELVRPDELRFADVEGGLGLVTVESVVYEGT